MRKIKFLFLIITVILIFATAITPVFAHSGRTDANGGHKDSSTGEYHYHHGHPAHQHTNGVCPYDNNKDTTEPANNEPLSNFEYILLFIFFIALIISIYQLYKHFCE